MCCVLALRLCVFMHALSGTSREDSGHLPWTFCCSMDSVLNGLTSLF